MLRILNLITSVGWLVAAITLLLLSVLTEGLQPNLFREVYCLAVSVLSPTAFFTFGWDKWMAKRDGRRIPEKTLHLLSLFGGWPGAVVGQQIFRHKTVKPPFRFVMGSIILIHVLIAAWAACLGP